MGAVLALIIVLVLVLVVRSLKTGLILGVLLLQTGTISAAENEAVKKIIIDADLNHFADDHEALVMLATLQRRGKLDILGLTLVTGNDWMPQISQDARAAVARLKLEESVPVFTGAEGPLAFSQEIFQQDYGDGVIFAGAFTRDKAVQPTPDSLDENLKPADGNAVDFLIQSIQENPGELTIVALGPLTNIALAIQQQPNIVAMIHEIIYMGGAVHAAGNVTPSAEFNWWFDPEAAKIVLGQPLSHVIVPLDATDRILFRQELYNRWVIERHPDHVMSEVFFRPKFAQRFANDTDYGTPVWDALVPALLEDPQVVINAQDYWISIDARRGPGYGQVIYAPMDREPGDAPADDLQKARVVLEMDEARFWEIYEDLIFD